MVNFKASLTKEHLDKAVSLYKEGKTLTEIANHFNLKSYDPVKRLFKEFNIKLKTRKESQINRTILKPASWKGAVGNRNRNWRGGRKIDKSGYILIYSPEHLNNCCNYVREHILIMEKHIGRYLKEEEVVHHKDFTKNNNDVNNLQLMTFSEHIKLHDSLRERDSLGRFIATPDSNVGEQTSEYAGNSLVDNPQGSLSDPSTTRC